jgi:hypothetical protein
MAFKRVIEGVVELY